MKRMDGRNSDTLELRELGGFLFVKLHESLYALSCEAEAGASLLQLEEEEKEQEEGKGGQSELARV